MDRLGSVDADQPHLHRRTIDQQYDSIAIDDTRDRIRSETVEVAGMGGSEEEQECKEDLHTGMLRDFRAGFKFRAGWLVYMEVVSRLQGLPGCAETSGLHRWADINCEKLKPSCWVRRLCL